MQGNVQRALRALSLQDKGRKVAVSTKSGNPGGSHLVEEGRLEH